MRSNMTRHFMGALMVFVMVLSVVSVADMAVESDDDSLVAAERGGRFPAWGAARPSITAWD